MNHIYLIAQREYIRTVRKPIFWISTLLLPTFIILVSFVSGYSADQAEKSIQEEAQNAQSILLYDPLTFIPEAFVIDPLEKVQDIDEAKSRIIDGSADALFIIPEDITTTKKVEVYTQDTGVMSLGKFDPVVQSLIGASVASQLDPQLQPLIGGGVTIESTYYKNGDRTEISLEKYVIPLAAFALYFLLVFMANNFLLTSVSEEKENRMIEIMFSIVERKSLIWGKIVGITLIAFTQIAVLVSATALIIYFSTSNFDIPIDLTKIVFDPVNISLYLFYILSGFLIIASVMVGVGSVMPTYKEAQSFSSIFIIASIFPMYFFSILLQEPTGTISQIVSYFPLTAPMVLAARLTLDALTATEIVVSSALVILYVIGGFYVAFKLFELGSLEYNNKVSFDSIKEYLIKKSN